MGNFKYIRISYNLWELLTKTSKQLSQKLNRNVTLNECLEYWLNRGITNDKNKTT